MAEHGRKKTKQKRVSGVGHWRRQRMSALVLFPLACYLVIVVASLDGLTHAQALGFVRMPVNACVIGVFVAAGLWHAKLGLEVVIEDYITVAGGRHIVLFAMRAVILALAGLCAWSLVRIIF